MGGLEVSTQEPEKIDSGFSHSVNLLSRCDKTNETNKLTNKQTNSIMSAPTYLDTRAGAFSSMRVNASWWEEQIHSICECSFDADEDDSTFEGWEWNSDSDRDMFYQEWEDKLCGLTSQILMGRITYETIQEEFHEIVSEYVDMNKIIIQTDWTNVENHPQDNQEIAIVPNVDTDDVDTNSDSEENEEILIELAETKSKKTLKINRTFKYDEYKNGDGTLGLGISYDSSKGTEWNHELYHDKKEVDLWNGYVIKAPQFKWVKKVIKYFNIKKEETRYFDFKCPSDGGWNMWESDYPKSADFVFSNGILYKRTYNRVKNSEWYVNEDNSTYQFKKYPISVPATDIEVEYKVWYEYN